MAKHDEVAIKIENVSKTFKLPHEKTTSIKSALLSGWRKSRTYEKQEALKDVSFEIKKGEFFGIVGRNGSGKSTLLKILAGIYTPTKGSVQIHGSLTPFIELGVGFNPELTGRENVFLNGALLGFNRKQMNAMYNDIVEFAELKRFMDQKLKNYSSGMQVRLAFSIAIRANSDILVLDEVLAVGDAAFQTKCFNYFYELKNKGATVVFVSHDRVSLERFCERGILINNGNIVEAGIMKKVLTSYSSIVLEEVEQVNYQSNTHDEKKYSAKSNYALITDVHTHDQNDKLKSKFSFGEKVDITFKVKVLKNITNPIIGVTVWQKNVDRPIFANNTSLDGRKKTGEYKPGDEIIVSQQLPNMFNDGEYYVEPAITNESATIFYDQQPKASIFHVIGSSNSYAILSSQDNLVLRKK